MSQQDDDNDNRQNIPTPETHGPSTNAPGPREESPQLDLPDDGQADDGSVEERQRERLSKIDRVRASLEAILLAADEPLTRDDLLEAFEDTAPEVVDRVLKQIELEFSGPARGIHLERISGGWQLRTNPGYDDRVRAMVEAQPVNLSRAALESLAIIAYQQPVTRAEVEEIRGVDSSGVLRTLQEWELVRVVGRLDDLGRPHVYGTTDRFLELFGLALQLREL